MPPNPLPQTLNDGRVVYGEVSLDAKTRFGYYPEQSDAIRGQKIEGGWVMQRSGPGGNDCKLSVVIIIDIKGWTTAFVINQAVAGVMGDIFEDVKKGLQQQKGR